MRWTSSHWRNWCRNKRKRHRSPEALTHFGGTMKNLVNWILLGALSMPFCAAHAQDKPQTNVNAERHAKAPVSARVQVVFMEFDGEKKVSSLPYSFVVIVEESNAGRYSVNLRTGVRVPVEIDGKDEKTTYFDVGTNIDCGVHYDEEGKF